MDAGVQVDSAEVAVGVGSVFLDSTRDFKEYAYRIDSIADIEWTPKPTAAEQAARDQLMKTYRRIVKPPQAAGSGDGWQVTVWMVQGRDLVTHTPGHRLRHRRLRQGRDGGEEHSRPVVRLADRHVLAR